MGRAKYKDLKAEIAANMTATNHWRNGILTRDSAPEEESKYDIPMHEKWPKYDIPGIKYSRPEYDDPHTGIKYDTTHNPTHAAVDDKAAEEHEKEINENLKEIKKETAEKAKEKKAEDEKLKEDNEKAAGKAKEAEKEPCSTILTEGIEEADAAMM